MALILLAGLKALPSDILEAASVDGATGPQKLRIIVIPLMLPAVLLALILGRRAVLPFVPCDLGALPGAPPPRAATDR